MTILVHGPRNIKMCVLLNSIYHCSGESNTVIDIIYHNLIQIYSTFLFYYFGSYLPNRHEQPRKITTSSIILLTFPTSYALLNSDHLWYYNMLFPSICLMWLWSMNKYCAHKHVYIHTKYTYIQWQMWKPRMPLMRVHHPPFNECV